MSSNEFLYSADAYYLREWERGLAFESYLSKRKALLTAIDGYFTQIEEAFFAERSKAPDPAIYDEVLLNIIRNCYASELINKTQEHFHYYVKERAKLELRFPDLDLRDKSELDKRIERELIRCGHAA